MEYGAVAGAVEIAAAFDHVCVRTGEGAALCGGNNSAGQLGDGTSERREAFVVAGITGAVGIAASGREFCAVADGGEVRCWGVQAGPRELDGGHLLRAGRGSTACRARRGPPIMRG